MYMEFLKGRIASNTMNTVFVVSPRVLPQPDNATPERTIYERNVEGTADIYTREGKHVAAFGWGDSRTRVMFLLARHELTYGPLFLGP